MGHFCTIHKVFLTHTFDNGLLYIKWRMFSEMVSDLAQGSSSHHQMSCLIRYTWDTTQASKLSLCERVLSSLPPTHTHTFGHEATQHTTIKFFFLFLWEVLDGREPGFRKALQETPYEMLSNGSGWQESFKPNTAQTEGEGGDGVCFSGRFVLSAGPAAEGAVRDGSFIGASLCEWLDSESYPRTLPFFASKVYTFTIPWKEPRLFSKNLWRFESLYIVAEINKYLIECFSWAKQLQWNSLERFICRTCNLGVTHRNTTLLSAQWIFHIFFFFSCMALILHAIKLETDYSVCWLDQKGSHRWETATCPSPCKPGVTFIIWVAAVLWQREGSRSIPLGLI